MSGHRRDAILLILFCLTMFPVRGEPLNQVSFADVLALHTALPDQMVVYGEARQQYGELWFPAAPSSTLVLLIHGGCWLNDFDVKHTRPMSAALRALGYAVWSIEYRRLGDPGGGWPGTFQDVAAAIDFAGGERFPLHPQHLVLMGHSAGGQLALWAAARAAFARTHPFFSAAAVSPEGVVGLAAIVDLASYAMGESACERAVVQLLGGAPEVIPDRYAAVSPIDLVLPANLHLLQGTHDTIVPPSLLVPFQQKHDVTVTLIDQAGHFDFIHPGAAAFQGVVSSLAELSQP